MRNVEARVIVQVLEHTHNRISVGCIQAIERCRSSITIHAAHLRTGQRRTNPPEPGAQRQRSGDTCAKGIDGLDAHAPWRLYEIPAQLLIARQRSNCGSESNTLVVRFWFYTFAGVSQCIDDPQLHFKRRFSSKGDRQDFFRIAHDCQQFQVALDQQFCFAGASGRLHD